MSKAVKGSILILVILLLISVGVAIMTLVQKQALEKDKRSLQTQVTDYEAKLKDVQMRAKKLEDQTKQLEQKIADKEKEKTQIEQTYNDIKIKLDKSSADFEKLTQDHEDLKNRAEISRQEHDDLTQKLQDSVSKIAQLEAQVAEQKKASEGSSQKNNIGKSEQQTADTDQASGNFDNTLESDDSQADQSEAAPVMEPPSKEKQDETYVSQLIKQKAALELQVEKMRKDLDQGAIQVVELKKQNSELGLEIKNLKNEKEEIERKIKYGQDLADNLSIELARAKNDQKFAVERSSKMKEENQDLQTQVKQLMTTKLALEKSISRLTDDKKNIEKKLVETDNVIQGRIDEIWQIKQDLDKRFDSLPKDTKEIELPPIIVNSGAPGQAKAQPRLAKHEGEIVSINDENNFVIVDMGQQDGIKVGDVFKVYRAAKEIASLEVIQVRRDIAAADIKEKVTGLRVGDQVR